MKTVKPDERFIARKIMGNYTHELFPYLGAVYKQRKMAARCQSGFEIRANPMTVEVSITSSSSIIGD